MFDELRYKRMIGHLLAQFDNKEVLEAIIYAVFAEIDELAKAFDDLQRRRWIDTGEGVQLDKIGEIIDRPRKIDGTIPLSFFGFKYQPSGKGFRQARFRSAGEGYLTSSDLLDDEYRRVLWLKVFKNTTNSTAEHTIAAFKRLLDCNRVIIHELGNAKMSVAVDRALSDVELLFIQAINLSIYTGGVGIRYLNTFNGPAYFGFRGQKAAKGFGIGSFARVFEL